jgi:DNA-binding transcriptional LysR family regulator
LALKTEREIKSSDESVSGDIHIGGGETDGMRLIACAAKSLRAAHPNIRIHLFSGVADDVTERLDKGLLDFGLLIEPADISKYDFLRLPITDSWGVLMRCDSPLAKFEMVRPKDLMETPLIAPRRELVQDKLSNWLGVDFDDLNIVATFNLILNAALMVEEGIGCAFALDCFSAMPSCTDLCFRPLEPNLESGIDLVWKKYHVLSKAAEKFLEQIKVD